MAIFTDFPCFLTPHTQGHLSRTKRNLFTKLGQCATEAPCQCLFEFQTHQKFDPKWWFCPTRGMAILLLFNSYLTRPSLENEEWSLYQTLSVCYWSPMYMFGWVSKKSKIWPKMVILPHPRYGNFYWFRLLFNSSHKRRYLDNEERSLHKTWSVCYWSPMSMFAWVSNKSKIWPKMVILPHPRYGDFCGFRLLFN